MDVSSSVETPKFKSQQNGSIEILKHLFQNKKASDTITVSGISFSNDAHSQFNESRDLWDIVNSIRKIKNLETGYSYLDVPLKYALDLFKQKKQNKQRRQSIIVIADGTYEKNDSMKFSTGSLLRHLEDMGVRVTGVFVDVKPADVRRRGFRLDQAFFFDSFGQIFLSAENVSAALRK